jgi:hypothetical protein
VRNTQGIKEFIQKWKGKYPSKELLLEYLPYCRDLLFQDEQLVVETIQILKDNITSWAQKYSKIYQDHPNEVFFKPNLMNKSDWFVAEITDFQPMNTSGSTTGEPFSYRRWDRILYPVECENHYDLIMDEFEIQDHPHILYFFDNRNHNDDIIKMDETSLNFMEHHGQKRKAYVHYVNFPFYTQHPDQFFDFLFNYQCQFDVVFAAGPQISNLHYQMQKNGYQGKFAKLLSNTCERLIKKDADFMCNHFDYICDHMRCWDGGATFFTCKKGTYHLLDNLSWCYSIGNKLVSTDYFSLASPFVNYWNGDYAELNTEYSRCECGRLYRQFKFLQNRPFAIKGKNITELKNKLLQLNLPIQQMRCYPKNIHVVSNRELNEMEKFKIKEIMDKFEIEFIVEGI